MKGNPVMKRKRTTGPTPQMVLRTHVACEKCGVCGAQPVVVVHNPDGTTTDRRCATHIDRAHAWKCAPSDESYASIMARVRAALGR